MSVVLDSSVLIDHLRGDEAATRFLAGLPREPWCSEITRVEVVRGMRAGERTRTEQLFRLIRWVPVDEPIARMAGDLGRRLRRSHHGIGAADLIVAASALTLGVELATANVRHFPMFRGLRPPY